MPTQHAGLLCKGSLPRCVACFCLHRVPPTEPLPAKGAPRAPSSSARGSSDGLGPQGREQARSRTPGGAPRNAQTQPRGPPIFSPASQQRGGLAHGPSRTRAEPSTAGARERDAYGRPVAKPQPESSTGGPRPGMPSSPCLLCLASLAVTYHVRGSVLQRASRRLSERMSPGRTRMQVSAASHCRQDRAHLAAPLLLQTGPHTGDRARQRAR